GLAGVDELLAGLAHQEGLHELLGHRHVEEVALLLLAAHLDEPLPVAPAHVRERAHRDVEERVLAVGHRLQDALRQLLDLGRGLLRDRVLALAGGHYSSSSARALAFFFASRASSSRAFCSSFISAAVTLCATCRNSFLIGAGFRPVILPIAAATSS